MLTLLRTILFFIPFLHTLASRPVPNSFVWDDIKYVYTFGDSYSYVYGSYGYPNISFIGSALNLSFTPEQLKRDLIIPNNTSTNHSIWVQFLTGCFEGSPFHCDRQLWDFACGGADISANLLPRHHNFTTSLEEEAEQYVRWAKDVIPHPSHETLTTWWTGVNDVVDPTMPTTNITDVDALYEAEFEVYLNSVQSTIDNGLHQHFFMNVPPMDRSPMYNTNATFAAEVAVNIEKFNTKLDEMLVTLKEKNPTVPILSYDVHALMEHILDNGEEFGFNDTTGYCGCDTPGFFWLNTEHPTQPFHVILAKDVEHFLRSQSSRIEH